MNRIRSCRLKIEFNEKKGIYMIHDNNMEVSIWIKWEIKIYVENEIDPYDRWMISNLLIILV
jgi:hypothetical protein